MLASAAHSIPSSSTAQTITTLSSAKRWAVPAPAALPTSSARMPFRNSKSIQMLTPPNTATLAGPSSTWSPNRAPISFMAQVSSSSATAVSIPPIRSPRLRARPNSPTISTSSAGMLAARFSRTAFSSFLTTTDSAISLRIWFSQSADVPRLPLIPMSSLLAPIYSREAPPGPVVSIRMFIWARRTGISIPMNS